MGKRGRKPYGKLEVLNPTIQKRPRPPYGMIRRSRALFKKIVDDSPVGVYDSEAVVLLSAFCDVENQRYLATKKVERFGSVMSIDPFVPINPTPFDEEAIEQESYIPEVTYKENPWYKIMKEMTTLLGNLSVKLRARGINSTSKPKETVNPRKGLMFGD